MKPNNILVLTHWDFEDALVQTYTLPYVKIIAKNIPRGSTIFLLTLDKTPTLKFPNLSEWNIKIITVPYQRFGLKGIWMWLRLMPQLIKLIVTEKISTIHSFCTPAGGMGYVLSTITRKKLIIDSYEPHAEAMVENGTWRKNDFAYKVMFLLEKLQTKKSTYLIAATKGMDAYAKLKYKHRKHNFFIKPACVDLALFSSNSIKNQALLDKLSLSNKIVCVYTGKFDGIYYGIETFTFFKAAFDFWGDYFRVLLLTNHSDKEIADYTKQVGLPNKVVIKRFVPHKDIANYIGLADFALTPVKPVPTKRYCTPIKDGEYWALGLPIVIPPNISDDSDIIRENKIGAIWNDTSEEGCLEAIKTIDELLKNNTREQLYAKIRPIAEKHRNFSIAEEVYKKIYGQKT